MQEYIFLSQYQKFECITHYCLKNKGTCMCDPAHFFSFLYFSVLYSCFKECECDLIPSLIYSQPKHVQYMLWIQALYNKINRFDDLRNYAMKFGKKT